MDNAECPLLSQATRKIAQNQTIKGVLVLCIIEPTVKDARYLQFLHRYI